MELTQIINTLDELETSFERFTFIENNVSLNNYQSTFEVVKEIISLHNSHPHVATKKRTLYILDKYSKLMELDIKTHSKQINLSHRLNTHHTLEEKEFILSISNTQLPEVKNNFHRENLIETIILNSYEVSILQTYILSAIDLYNLNM